MEAGYRNRMRLVDLVVMNGSGHRRHGDGVGRLGRGGCRGRTRQRHSRSGDVVIHLLIQGTPEAGNAKPAKKIDKIHPKLRNEKEIKKFLKTDQKRVKIKGGEMTISSVENDSKISIHELEKRKTNFARTISENANEFHFNLTVIIQSVWNSNGQTPDQLVSLASGWSNKEGKITNPPRNSEKIVTKWEKRKFMQKWNDSAACRQTDRHLQKCIKQLSSTNFTFLSFSLGFFQPRYDLTLRLDESTRSPLARAI